MVPPKERLKSKPSIVPREVGVSPVLCKPPHSPLDWTTGPRRTASSTSDQNAISMTTEVSAKEGEATVGSGRSNKRTSVAVVSQSSQRKIFFSKGLKNIPTVMEEKFN